MSVVKAIIGLGNPGPDYAKTRHNAGALFVEELARFRGASLRPEKKYHGQYCKVQIDGQDIHLLNPSTFMNRSGLSVKALTNFFKISADQILVAHDELDIPPGTAKLKQGGGHGGHNGLRDIISQMGGDKNFYRLRLGIGHPGSADKVSGFVLGQLGKSETEQLNAVIDESIRVLPEIMKGNLQQAMNRLHSFKA